ncbi:type II secretion system protein N [Zobellella sp. DQSA1]|uniref:type II secretion system protein N n=1 Tax=Zobellella sp. DQSA1 TaxID=3342386 RepID=UPI0035C1024A
MSTKVKVSAGLLLAYLLLLVVHAPAQLLRYVLPASLQVEHFSGSLWRGSLHRLGWRNLAVAEIRWQPTFSAFCPAFRVEFNDPFGIRGQGSVCGWREWHLRQWRLSAPAGYVWQQFSSSYPLMDAQGQVQLDLAEGAIDRNGCISLGGGTINWHHGKLNTPLGEVPLATPRLSFHCEQRGLALALQHNAAQLRLTGRGRVDANGGYRIEGQFFAGERFSATLAPFLSALGRQNAQGEIVWQLEGRLK